MKYHYTVVLTPETDPDFNGYYNAAVPALPGCFSYGATKEEALRNIKEAILLYIEDLKAEGEPVPIQAPWPKSCARRASRWTISPDC